MGSIGNTGRLAAFQSDVFATGLDLNRGEIPRNLGVWRAADAATIRQGQLVGLNTNEQMILYDADVAGIELMGFSKFDKLPGTGVAIMVDEAISFAALAGNTTLSRTSGVNNLAIYSAVGRGGTRYVDTLSYTFTAAGVVTHINPGVPAIPAATTVYATFTHDLVAADYDFQGRNFFNSNDDVTVAEGRLTVIQGPATIFTTEYIINDNWAVGDNVRALAAGAAAADEGMVTNAGAGTIVGRCIQVPNAADPYLGIQVTRV